jgi:putative peptide zinc metalloprotease protein
MAGILTFSEGDVGPATRAPEQAAAEFLPPLREDLVLEAGPSLYGGTPSWTIYDPPTNRFFRIGWLELEIISRWHLRTPEQIATRIAAETTLAAMPEDVKRFARFLEHAQLLRGAAPAATRRLLDRQAAGKQGWLLWLVHHYLFIRIPLIRPDRFLDALLPRVRWVYTRAFLIVTLVAATLGGVLVARQWDDFQNSFPWFFSLEGGLFIAAALLLSKALHELGHGLTAKLFGCRVPSMGLALLVLAPVLYTDTSAAWRLRERRKRLAIGAAGVAAECSLAAYALLAWALLPDGLLRSIAFVWATTTWILSLLINLSPFLRFDGYYLLSDLMGVANLQERSFALTRHWLRELLFGLGDPPPEAWPRAMRTKLIAYATATWIYRFVLFVGIAILVYHLFFKLLGIVLFAIELWWFIVRPILREFSVWFERSRARSLSARTAMTIAAFASLLMLAIVPWQSAVHAPGLLTAQMRLPMFSQLPAQVSSVLATNGQPVEEGQTLVKFSSPDIRYKLEQASRRVEILKAQILALSQDPELQSRRQVVLRELEGARAEWESAALEDERLDIRAPKAGRLMDLYEPLNTGDWLKAGELIGLVVDTSSAHIEAYANESDLERIAVGNKAIFVPADVSRPGVRVKVVAIDVAAARTLPDQELASLNGGAIAARVGPNDTMVPEIPVYKLILTPEDDIVLNNQVIGTVIINGRRVSLAGVLWRKAVGVVIRESGF